MTDIEVFNLIDYYLSLTKEEQHKIDKAVRKIEDEEWLSGRHESFFNTHNDFPGV